MEEDERWGGVDKVGKEGVEEAERRDAVEGGDGDSEDCVGCELLAVQEQGKASLMRMGRRSGNWWGRRALAGAEPLQARRRTIVPAEVASPSAS